MEKQLDFWKDKCLDLKLNLNMQHVEDDGISTTQTAKMQETQDQLEKKVRELQKEEDSSNKENKNLKAQIVQKDQ